MILTCPACGTRYRVGKKDLAAPDGRTVRCANCGHIWRQVAPAPEARSDEAAAGVEALPGEPGVRTVPDPLSASRFELSPGPSPPASPTTTDERRVGTAALRWGAAILVLIIVTVLAGIFASNYLAAVWAPAGRLYASIGLPVEPAAAGLAIEKIAPVRSGEGLVIDGEIANRGSAPTDVPRLRVVLRDAAAKEVQFEIVDPPKAQLQPGEIVHFATPFPHPADNATGVVVTFAAR